MVQSVEKRKGIIRWNDGQFFLIIVYKALGDDTQEYYAVRHSVGDEYGFRLFYSHKSLIRFFRSVRKRVVATLPLPVLRELYKVEDALVVKTLTTENQGEPSTAANIL